MATKGGFIDMDKFQFCGETIRAISEMIMEDTIQGPDLTSIHTIYPNIVTQTELGFIGEGGLVGVKSNGCSPTEQDWDIATRIVKWDPAEWEIRLKQCYVELQSAATVYSLRTGVDIPDFTETDYMNLVVQVLEKSIRDFWYRLYWFNDKDATAADFTAITEDQLVYFNIIDGLFKQLETQATENTSQHITIAENADSSNLDSSKISDYLSQLVFSAPMELRSSSDRMILCTQSVYDALTMYLATSCCLESARTTLLNGTSTNTFMGIPVIAMPIWDKLINAYGIVNPHRAVFTTKANLGLGVDAIDSFEKMRIWYENKDRQVYIELMGKADAKLINPKMFTYAY